MTDLPSTMKAMVLTGHGGPEKLEYRTDVPVPAPAPGEVLIEVSACGMNNTDLKVREAAYAVDFDPNSGAEEEGAAASIAAADGTTSLTFPRIQGADTVGRIVAVGDGVAAARMGERVLVDFSLYHGRDAEGRPAMDLWNVDYIGHGRDGGYAEYVAVPAENAHAIGREIEDAALATFGCSTLTAEHMLARVDVRAGQYVLVTGASGGVGSAAVQLVRARGALPIAVTSRSKEEALLALGAEACVARQDFEDADGRFDGRRFVDVVAEAAGGSYRVDAVVDQVGGTMFHSLLRCLKPDGHYITAGTIAGYTPRINLHTVYMAFLNIHGSSQGQPRDFARIVGHIEAGRIAPVLGGAFPLSRLHEAQEAFRRKSHIGNLVIVPDAKWEAVGQAHAL
ncbi:zinc-binding dehydrogenase [Marivibrio halodurans]|uniref:Zinc-binding dehydrogenase n=1 Tax=Marivibrio halodurans TaxID=2039722 RepID=A0A8J7V2X8_9PROT|nr:zinc-binding dehydrogenase [Marivibrio halodurans]